MNCTATTPTLSVALAEILTVPATVAPETGAIREIVGGVVSFATVKLTAAEVAVLPAASRATAVRVCAPSLAVVAVQEREWGATVTLAPRFLPSSLNWTQATPTLSVALAEIVTVPATVAPATGAIREIVGGVLSTVTLTAAVVAVLPAVSRATAVKVWEPLAASVVFQEMAYGAAVTSAPRLTPSRLNCTPATPTLSVALAARVSVPPTVALASGEGIE